MNFESGKLASLSYARIIWAPTLTFHDPNPPITIEQSGLTGTVSESATASSTQTATVAFVGAVSETATATESQNTGTLFSDSVAETVTASHSQQAIVAFVAAVSETATATDSSTGTTGGTAFTGSVSESVSASDSCDATVTIPSAPDTPTANVEQLVGLYGLLPIGVASESAAVGSVGAATGDSGLAAIGVSGNSDSLRPI